MIGIIGGTGFIGINLSWYLQKEKVPCRTFSRNGLLLDPKSIHSALLNEIENVRGDFRDKSAVQSFVQGCRSVVLLVSHLLPSSSTKEIKVTASWFTAAFGQLLELCRTHQVEQLVFVSSGGTIYGENTAATPVTEDYPLNAQSAYGTFCALLERMVHAFYHEHGLPFTILRVGNPYGPLKRPNKDQGLIDHYIHSARAGRAFTLFGDGNEVRDYIYIDDVSESMRRVLQSSAQNSVFNVGTGIGHSTHEVIRMVKDQFQLPEVQIILQGRRPGEVVCSLLNMDKFEKAYGMRCNTSLSDGLKEYALLEAAM